MLETDAPCNNARCLAKFEQTVCKFSELECEVFAAPTRLDAKFVFYKFDNKI